MNFPSRDFFNNSSVNDSQVPIIFDTEGSDGSPVHNSIVFPLIELTVSFFGVVLNIAVLASTIRFLHACAHRKKSVQFFVSLGFSDLIICAVTMPINTVSNSGILKFSDTSMAAYLCMTMNAINVVATSSSSFTVVLIALDRYICLTYPAARAMVLTPTVLKSTLLCMWVISFILGMPPIYLGVVKMKDIGEANGRCLMKMGVDYSIIMVTILILVPCFTICILYGRMFHICHRYIVISRNRYLQEKENGHARDLEQSDPKERPPQTGSSSSFQIESKSWIVRDQRLTQLQIELMMSVKSIIIKRMGRSYFHTSVTLAIVVGLFILHWLPFGVVNIIDITHPGGVPYAFRRTCMWLVLLNSCWNPIVYTLSNPTVRAHIYGRRPACLRTSTSTIIVPVHQILGKDSTSIMFPELEPRPQTQTTHAAPTSSIDFDRVRTSNVWDLTDDAFEIKYS